MKHPAVDSILGFYDSVCDTDNYSWMRWSERRTRFTIDRANAFFLGVLLDQGQRAERAWAGGEHMAASHFQHPGGFWAGVAATNARRVRTICQTGFEGTSYASNFAFNKLPLWLKSASTRMIDVYGGDPRNIWSVKPHEVALIYDRFVEFDGIGDALGKMAQFILVRNHGIAGGRSSQHMMSIKPDELVRRVVHRTGISPTNRIGHVVAAASALELKSPADFDAAAWTIGREYCGKSEPRCGDCPISGACDRVGLEV